MYQEKDKCTMDLYEKESNKVEAVTVCVGFGGILKETIIHNHREVDHLIVVTSFADQETQAICHQYGVTCVPTDLIYKDGRNFNKGAAINAGFGYFKYHGWRLHLDSDIILPDNFHRVLMNHTHLEQDCLYGATRVDVIGKANLDKYRTRLMTRPQSMYHTIVSQNFADYICLQESHYSSAQYNSDLDGYCPIGFFQLFHSSYNSHFYQAMEYPYSLGTAAHDDILFARKWPRAKRHLLPNVIVGHLLDKPAVYAAHWEGKGEKPRLDK